MESKYPLIVIDKRQNSPNLNRTKTLTVEEYYDLLHHTHHSSDIIGGEGGESPSIDELINTINEMKNTITTLTARVVALENAAEDITDYDLDTPGIQDINGNTIG